jgi:hypothetical protein
VAVLTGNSGRTYTSLPINAQSGFPQSFPFQMDDGSSYRFTLYVDVDAAVLDGAAAPLTLPITNAFLVVRVERLSSDGTSQIVFLRKVVPEQEYLAENIALMFPMQVVAQQNINGQGDFGSQVVGGIAPRWA